MIQPERLRDNPTIAPVFKRLEDARLRVDTSLLDELASYLDEAQGCQNSSAGSYRTVEDIHSLAGRFEQIQHIRNRVGAIRVAHLPVRRALKRMVTAATTCLNQMGEIEKLKPVAHKAETIAWILEPLVKRVDQCDTVVETAEHVEKLLSSAYYTLRELKEINQACLDAAKKERGV